MAAPTRPVAAALFGTPAPWASDDSHNTEPGFYFGPADQNGSWVSSGMASSGFREMTGCQCARVAASRAKRRGRGKYWMMMKCSRLWTWTMRPRSGRDGCTVEVADESISWWIRR